MGELKVAQPTVSILTILHVYLDLAPPCQKKSEISQPPLPPRQKKLEIGKPPLPPLSQTIRNWLTPPPLGG